MDYCSFLKATDLALSWVGVVIYDLWVHFRLIGMVIPLDTMVAYLKLEIRQKVVHLRYGLLLICLLGIYIVLHKLIS